MIVVLVGVGGWVELVIALLLLSVEIPLAFCASKEMRDSMPRGPQHSPASCTLR